MSVGPGSRGRPEPAPLLQRRRPSHRRPPRFDARCSRSSCRLQPEKRPPAGQLGHISPPADFKRMRPPLATSCKMLVYASASASTSRFNDVNTRARLGVHMLRQARAGQGGQETSVLPSNANCCLSSTCKQSLLRRLLDCRVSQRQQWMECVAAERPHSADDTTGRGIKWPSFGGPSSACGRVWPRASSESAQKRQSFSCSTPVSARWTPGQAAI